MNKIVVLILLSSLVLLGCPPVNDPSPTAAEEFASNSAFAGRAGASGNTVTLTGNVSIGAGAIVVPVGLTLIVPAGTSLALGSGASFTVSSGAAVLVQSGGNLYIDTDAVLIVNAGAGFNVEPGAVFILNGTLAGSGSVSDPSILASVPADPNRNPPGLAILSVLTDSNGKILIRLGGKTGAVSTVNKIPSGLGGSFGTSLAGTPSTGYSAFTLTIPTTFFPVPGTAFKLEQINEALDFYKGVPVPNGAIYSGPITSVYPTTTPYPGIGGVGVAPYIYHINDADFRQLQTYTSPGYDWSFLMKKTAVNRTITLTIATGTGIVTNVMVIDYSAVAFTD
ncbi:hypothetical protein ACYULU_06660 [Breznakiellaceae bacterium SP9]